MVIYGGIGGNQNIHLHSLWYGNGASNAFARVMAHKIYYILDVKSQN